MSAKKLPTELDKIEQYPDTWARTEQVARAVLHHAPVQKGGKAKAAIQGEKKVMQFRALIVAAVCAVITLQGCTPPPPPAPYRWSKPGGEYDSYLKDRYACIQDARVNVSGAVVNGTGGYASSGQVVSANIFLPCMAARGWMQDPNGYGPPPGGDVALVQ